MKDEVLLKFRACWTDGSKIFFSAVEFNGLFCMDLDNNSVEYVKSFDKSALYTTYLHLAPFVRYGNKLVLFPSADNHISVIDCNTYKENTILINKNTKKNVFIATTVKEKFAWAFSAQGEILVFDIEKEEVIKQFVIRHSYANNPVLWHICEKTQMAWGVITNTNHIIRFNLTDEYYEIISMPDDSIHLSRLVVVGESLFCAQEDNADIIEWNLRENTVKRYGMYNKSGRIERKIPSYGKLLYIEEKGIIILTGLQDKAIYLLDINSKVVTAIEDFPEGFVLKKDGCGTLYFCEETRVGDEVWFLPEQGNGVLRYNIYSDEMSANKVAIDRESIMGEQYGFTDLYRGNVICLEDGNLYSLDGFLKMI